MTLIALLIPGGIFVTMNNIFAAFDFKRTKVEDKAEANAVKMAFAVQISEARGHNCFS